MSLEVVWFILIAVLWTGYFVLEGFDFGVGMLLPFLGRTEEDRKAMLNSIGPVWDGNEVWLIVAAGATFAAFPLWYATMFSGFYLALLLILVCLILRVLSFDWRGRSESPRWQRFWTRANAVCSAGASLVWGVALANLIEGLPIGSDHHYTGSVLDLFSPFTIFSGLATVLLFLFHGSGFLSLRAVGELGERAATTARRLAGPAVLAGTVLMIWIVIVAVENNARGVLGPAVPAAIGSLALSVSALAAFRGRAGVSFTFGAIGIAGYTATLFTGLFPRVMVSSTDFASSLSTANAAASDYSLTVITIVAGVLLPVILAYQGWSYWVFRHRVSAGGFDEVSNPIEALRRRSERGGES
ncbi:MAG: cytochrome d ubiquinol oxidase subunit II [Solirubrobacterales bacterium]|nr:cytochrome d ubiquinol oxidase subunit II [Solirubrobacterales bacterium]